MHAESLAIKNASLKERLQKMDDLQHTLDATASAEQAARMEATLHLEASETLRRDLTQKQVRTSFGLHTERARSWQYHA